MIARLARQARPVALALTILVPGALSAETVTIPFGTTVYCELDEEVVSKKKFNKEGDIVRSHVWRDVLVDGRVVIEAGTPVYVRIARMKSAKVAGIKGKIELEALNVTAIDGRDVSLQGGYDRSGKGRMALSITLAAVVFVPLIFIKGKQARLEPGTVFDAIVRNAVEVEVESDRPPKISLDGVVGLDVEILYDEIDEEGKLKTLPLKITSCDGPVGDVFITAVNEKPIDQIPVQITRIERVGCDNSYGEVDLKVLGEHLTKGINRFDVQAGDKTAQVMLEVEL